MDRSAFLDRFRGRLAAGAPPNVAHPLVRVDAVPLVRYDQDLTDVVAAFSRNAVLQGTVVEQPDDPVAFVTRIVTETGAQKVVISRDPEVEAVRDAVGAVEVLAFDSSPADADLGIVGAGCGIAATGTVVFDAGRAGGRSASLLPPSILVLIRRSAIVRDAGEIFRRMPEHFPNGLPSQLVFCTGPSKSGDIELQLTTGVHGPGRVWVGVVDG